MDAPVGVWEQAQEMEGKVHRQLDGLAWGLMDEGLGEEGLLLITLSFLACSRGPVASVSQDCNLLQLLVLPVCASSAVLSLGCSGRRRRKKRGCPHFLIFSSHHFGSSVPV